MKKIIKAVFLSLLFSLMIISGEAMAENISAYGLTSSDSRIQIYGDYIGAFSFGESHVSSEEITSLVNSNTGWTVEGWTSAPGASLEDTDDVSGGYLVLSKIGDEDAFIPIKCSAQASKTEASGSVHCVIGGFAATSSDNQSYVISTENTALKAFSGIEITQEKTEYTYAFNIYADGGSVLEICFRKNDMAMCKLLDWQSNGVCNLYSSTNSVDSTVALTETMERGQWHRVVVMFDMNRGRFHIYIDGVLKGKSFGGMWGAVVNKIAVGAGKGSVNGTVAFGKVKGSYGITNEEYEELSISSTDDALNITDNVIAVDVSSVENVDEVITHISTNAANVRVYKDSSYKEEADKVSASSVLVLSNSDETSFKYYKLIPAQIEISNVAFHRENSMVYASADAKYNSQNSKLLTAVLTIKDKDGRVCKLITSPTTQVSAEKCTFSMSSQISDTEYAEMFFIDNWTSRLGYEYKYYKEAK